MSVGKFVEVNTSASSLKNFFKPIKPRNGEKESIKCDDSKKDEHFSVINEDVSETEPVPGSCHKEQENPSKNDPHCTPVDTLREPVTEMLDYQRAWSPVPYASEEPEFANGLIKILDHLCKSPSTDVHDDPVPSTSKGIVPPSHKTEHAEPSFDYSKSFFCKTFKDKVIYAPIRYEESFTKGNSSSDRSISAGALGTDNEDSQLESSTSMDVDNALASTSAPEIMERCAECHKLVPLIDFLEHLDLHAALKLQRELNRAEMAASRAEMSMPVPSKAPEKRKSKKMKLQSPPKKNQPITAFFSVKPSR